MHGVHTAAASAYCYRECISLCWEYILLQVGYTVPPRLGVHTATGRIYLHHWEYILIQVGYTSTTGSTYCYKKYTPWVERNFFHFDSAFFHALECLIYTTPEKQDNISFPPRWRHENIILFIYIFFPCFAFFKGFAYPFNIVLYLCTSVNIELYSYCILFWSLYVFFLFAWME
jgi:hypothetical protein